MEQPSVYADLLRELDTACHSGIASIACVSPSVVAAYECMEHPNLVVVDKDDPNLPDYLLYKTPLYIDLGAVWRIIWKERKAQVVP